jgi:hypothetical protein
MKYAASEIVGPLLLELKTLFAYPAIPPGEFYDVVDGIYATGPPTGIY